MPARLIINADDFGAAGTVEPIVELYEAGVVTSTSAMVNQPDWPRAAAYLRDHPGLGAGVHLVMGEGRPLLPPEQVPSLVDERGAFREDTALLRRFLRLRTRELRAEWRAQIAKFVADTGRPPDHLDLHTFVPYVFSSWFRVSLDLARAYGRLPVRLPFDDAFDRNAPHIVAATQAPVPVWLARWQGRRYRRTVSRYGLARPNYFEASFSTPLPGHRTTTYLLALLDALPDGTTEILCHPGLDGWRAEDYGALRDPRVRERLAQPDIERIDFRALLAA